MTRTGSMMTQVQRTKRSEGPGVKACRCDYPGCNETPTARVLLGMTFCDEHGTQLYAKLEHALAQLLAEREFAQWCKKHQAELAKFRAKLAAVEAERDALREACEATLKCSHLSQGCVHRAVMLAKAALEAKREV